MKILLLDNYDSFTYNLVHLLESFSEVNVTVKRNDEISLQEIANFDRIVLSPGPGLPSEAGKMMEVIERYQSTKPILGVCLGHQAIVESFGGKLKNMETVLHGVASKISVPDRSEKLFLNFPDTFSGGHYHSWTADENYFPSSLKITAKDEQGNIMALRHTKWNICGVQFHPESILTEHGKLLMKNWMNS